MIRRIITALLVVVALLVAIQFVRPERTNPPTEARETIQAHVSDAAALAVIARSCRDCHTHDTAWPWYSQVAPTSWLVARDVNVGRRALNFSRWAAYGVERQRKLLRDACESVSEGEMPVEIYTMMHPSAHLTRADIDAICSLSPRERERSND